MGTQKIRYSILVMALGTFIFGSAVASSAGHACERRLLPTFGETRSGFYEFNDSGMPRWVGDDGMVSSFGNGGYLTGDASHLAILRRQVGELRFREIMLSRDPEAAAQAAIEADIRSAQSALPADLIDLQIRLRGAIGQIPLDQPVPQPLFRLALALLERHGLYSSGGIEAYLAMHIGRFSLDELFRGRSLKVIDMPIVIGSVEAWRRGAEAQTTTLRLISLEKAIDGVGASPVSYVFYHMNFVRLLQEVFGPARVIFNPGDRPPGSLTEYYQTYIDSDGEPGRGIQYRPLFLELRIQSGRVHYSFLNRQGAALPDEPEGSIPIPDSIFEEFQDVPEPPREEPVSVRRERLRSGAGIAVED